MPGHDSLGHHNVWKFLGWYILFAAGAGHVFLFLVYCSFSLLRTAGAYKWVPGSYIVPAIVRFFGLQAGVPCQIRKMHTWNRCIFVLFAVFSNNCKWHFVWQLWRKLQRDGCCHSSWRLCIKLSFRLAEGLAAHRMRHKHNGKSIFLPFQVPNISTPLSIGVHCKLRSNGMPVPLLRNGYSIFNGTKYR